MGFLLLVSSKASLGTRGKVCDAENLVPDDKAVGARESERALGFSFWVEIFPGSEYFMRMAFAG